MNIALTGYTLFYIYQFGYIYKKSNDKIIHFSKKKNFQKRYKNDDELKL